MRTGPQLSQPITCMAAHRDLVFTAVGNDIMSWTRGKQVQVYMGHEAPVHTMLCFGDHLIAVDDNNVMKIWDIATGGMVAGFGVRGDGKNCAGLVREWTGKRGRSWFCDGGLCGYTDGWRECV